MQKTFNMRQEGDNFMALRHLRHNNTEFYLISCGIEQCLEKHSYGPGKRDKFLIHFILSGKGYFLIDGIRYDLKKGDAFIIYPNTSVYYAADSREPWTYTWVGFYGTLASIYLEQALIQDDTHVIHIEDIDYIQKIIHKMLSLQHFNFSDELQHQAMLLEIFSKLINERNKTQQCRDLVPINSHVEDALQYISANYMNNISIADIAHFVKLSNAHLNSCFKNHLNTTPQQYLTRYRIEKACQLILNTNSSITDISQQVGYSDSLTFSKAFKKLLGTSPSIWRSNT